MSAAWFIRVNTVRFVMQYGTNKLVIVDTTAAPVLYVVAQWYPLALCSSLKYTDS